VTHAVGRPFPLALTLVVLLGASQCARQDDTRQFVLQGQVLGVHPDRMALTVRHDAIPDFMAAMTMTFPVAERALLDGRTPGETITATLEVRNNVGRLVAITHTGTAPLPSSDDARLAVGDLVPEAALIDQTDRRRSLSDWRGYVTVLTFTHARCQDEEPCATIAQRFAGMQRAVRRDDRMRERVRLISIGVDPAHDSPAALTSAAARYHADPTIWSWLSGDAITIDRLARRFAVEVLPRTGASPALQPRTAVIRTDGRLAALRDDHRWTEAELLDEIRRALDAR
jgi:protein SCO1/2